MIRETESTQPIVPSERTSRFNIHEKVTNHPYTLAIQATARKLEQHASYPKLVEMREYGSLIRSGHPYSSTYIRRLHVLYWRTINGFQEVKEQNEMIKSRAHFFLHQELRDRDIQNMHFQLTSEIINDSYLRKLVVRLSNVYDSVKNEVSSFRLSNLPQSKTKDSCIKLAITLSRIFAYDVFYATSPTAIQSLFMHTYLDELVYNYSVQFPIKTNPDQQSVVYAKVNGKAQYMWNVLLRLIHQIEWEHVKQDGSTLVEKITFEQFIKLSDSPSAHFATAFEQFNNGKVSYEAQLQSLISIHCNQQSTNSLINRLS